MQKEGAQVSGWNLETIALALSEFILQWSRVITNTVNMKFLIKRTLLGGPRKAPIVYCIFPYHLTLITKFHFARMKS